MATSYFIKQILLDIKSQISPHTVIADFNISLLPVDMTFG